MSRLSKPLLYTLVVLAGWTVWCGLMAWRPDPFAEPLLRALVRIGLVLGAALIYWWRERRDRPVLTYFMLRGHLKQGLLVATVGILILIRLYWGTDGSELLAMGVPAGFTTWLNLIIGSPLAEEMFFRGVLYQEIRAKSGLVRGLLISSVAFSALHLPQWLLLNDLGLSATLTNFGNLILYGVAFAVFVELSKSLWGALLPHWVNNYLSIALNS